MRQKRSRLAPTDIARAELAGAASAEVAYQAEHADPSPEAPGADLTAAAFFDVDNTMMAGASTFHYARGLAARKFFTTGDLVRFAVRQVKFRMAGEDAEDMSDAREEALSFVAGREVAQIIELGEEIYDELMADKIYPGTRALAQRHLDAGQRVWLVTATPVELAQIIARRLGLTGAMGTVAATENGVYTGRLVGELLHGKAKAAAVRALAVREGLDLRRCTAYSDSINDLPMLSVVGTPVVINPDGDLRDIARKNRWQIIDYRTGRRAATNPIVWAGVATAAAGVLSGFVVIRIRRRLSVRAA